MTGPEQFYTDKRVAITGGLGTIGSTIARQLASTGADILIVDRETPTYGGRLFNIAGIEGKVTLYQSDSRDAETDRRLFADRHVIFNLAGRGGHSDSMRDPMTDLEMNCRGHLALLEACRDVNPDVKIVYASTRQIYGAPDRLPVREDHALRPVDVNGIHKLAGEQYHLLYHKVYGIRTCSLRLTNVIGPRMRVADSLQIFYGAWTRLLLEGLPFEVWGGQQIRDLLYVDDAASAFLAAGANDQADGLAFNVGNGEGLSLQAFADLLVEANGGGSYTIKPLPGEQRSIDIGDYYGDISKIRDVLGWQPRVALRDALVRTMAYFRKYLGDYI